MVYDKWQAMYPKLTPFAQKLSHYLFSRFQPCIKDICLDHEHGDDYGFKMTMNDDLVFYTDSGLEYILVTRNDESGHAEYGNWDDEPLEKFFDFIMEQILKDWNANYEPLP